MATDYPRIGTAAVTLPASSTDHAVARWDGANADTLQNSPLVVTDAGAASGLTSVAMGGALSGVVGLTMSGDLNSPDNITITDTGRIKTQTTASKSYSLSAYDVDGTAWIDFVTLTSGNDPTCTLHTGITQSGRKLENSQVSSVEVPIVSGGTGYMVWCPGVGRTVTAIELISLEAISSAAGTITLTVLKNGTTTMLNAANYDLDGTFSALTKTAATVTATAADLVLSTTDYVLFTTSSSVDDVAATSVIVNVRHTRT